MPSKYQALFVGAENEEGSKIKFPISCSIYHNREHILAESQTNELQIFLDLCLVIVSWKYH